MFDIVKSHQIVGAIHELPASFVLTFRAIRESPLRVLRINSVIIEPDKTGFVGVVNIVKSRQIVDLLIKVNRKIKKFLIVYVAN